MIPSYWRLAAVLVLLVIVVRVTAESLRLSEVRDRDWREQRQSSRGNAQFAADHERYHLSTESKRFSTTQRGATLAIKDTDALRYLSRVRNAEAELSKRAFDIQRSAKSKDRQIRDVHHRRVGPGQESRAEGRDQFEQRNPADDLLVRTHRRMVEDRRSNPTIADHLNRIDRSPEVRHREINIRSIDAGDDRRSKNLIRVAPQELQLQLQRNERSNTLVNRNSLNYRNTFRTEDNDGEQERIGRKFNIDRDHQNVGDRNRLCYRSSRRNMAENRYTDSNASRRAELYRSRRFPNIKESEEQEISDDRNLRFNRRTQLYERQDRTSGRINSRRANEDRNHRSLQEEISRNRRVTETMERSNRFVDRRASDKNLEEVTNVQQKRLIARPIISIRENNERNNRREGDLKEHLNRLEHLRRSESRFERVSRRESSAVRRQAAVTRNARLITYPSVRSERLQEHQAVQRNIFSTGENNLGNDRRAADIAKHSVILKDQLSRFERATTQLNDLRDSRAVRNNRSVREKRQDTERKSRESQELTYRRQNRANQKVRDNVRNDQQVTETIERIERFEDRKVGDIRFDRNSQQFNNRRSFIDDTKRRSTDTFSENFESRRNRLNDRSDIPVELNQDIISHRVDRQERRVSMKSNTIIGREVDTRGNEYISRNSFVINEMDVSDERTKSRNRMDRTQRRVQAMSRLEDSFKTRIDKRRNLDADAGIVSRWSWQLCQALLISAILAQFFKSRDGLDKRMR